MGIRGAKSAEFAMRRRCAAIAASLRTMLSSSSGSKFSSLDIEKRSVAASGKMGSSSLPVWMRTSSWLLIGSGNEATSRLWDIAVEALLNSPRRGFATSSSNRRRARSKGMGSMAPNGSAHGSLRLGRKLAFVRGLAHNGSMRFGSSLAGAIAFLLLGNSWQNEARAWGNIGHRAALTVVENHLTPAAAAAIRDL